MAAEIIHVHAGLHKTGSTSIQHMLAEETPGLAAAGFSVWSISANHSIPLRLVFDAAGEGARGPLDAERFGDPASVVRHLADEIGRSRRNFVISAEAISAFHLASLERFAATLHEAAPGAEIRVVVYVRRPDRHAPSYVQQLLKRGHTIAHALDEMGVLKFRLRIGTLMKVFGRDRVDVRLAPELDEAGPTRLLADYLAAIGAPALTVRSEAAANPSLSMEAVLLMDQVNSLAQQEGQPNVRYGRLVQVLRTALPGPSYRLSEPLLREIVAAHRDDFDWLAEETGIVLRLPEDLEPPAAVEPLSPSVVRLVLGLIGDASAAGRRKPRGRLGAEPLPPREAMEE